MIWWFLWERIAEWWRWQVHALRYALAMRAYRLRQLQEWEREREDVRDWQWSLDQDWER